MSLPDYDTLGQMIVNRLGEFEKNSLARQQSKNALLKNKYAEPEAEAEIANKIATTKEKNFKSENPFFGQPGAIGQLGATELLRRNPNLIGDPNALNQLEKSNQLTQQSQESLNALRNQQSSGYSFNSLPVTTKEYILAQGAGMGIYPDDMRKELLSGKSVNDIAVEHGFDPKNMPEPVYPLTKEGQTQLKMRQSSLKEMEKLSKKVTDWSGPYARQIMGISPQLFKEAVTGQNKEGQAKFYAAQMLAPEQAAIRYKTLGGQVGIGAIEEMTGRALLNGRTFQSLVSPEVYKRANELVEEAISEAVAAANKESTRAVSTPVSEAANVTKQPEKSDIMTYNPKTGRLE